MDPAADIEQDQKIRLDEIRFLHNICANLSSEDEKSRMRRAMVVMLYSHFEGFTEFTLEVYRRFVDQSKLKCCEVQPALATAALRDLFKAFQNPEGGRSYLPKELMDARELRPLAIQRAFVADAWVFGQRRATIPDGYVDTESNLKPIVLRKNLFRLGLPHDLFDGLEDSINKLLHYRNNIAHGKRDLAIDETDYDKLFIAVSEIMDELRRSILKAISTQAFRL
jgi:RiboL-PSP-HEPN